MWGRCCGGDGSGQREHPSGSRGGSSWPQQCGSDAGRNHLPLGLGRDELGAQQGRSECRQEKAHPEQRLYCPNQFYQESTLVERPQLMAACRWPHPRDGRRAAT